MNTTVVGIIILLLAGFVVGWGLEFGLDLVFWRRRADRIVRYEGMQRGEASQSSEIMRMPSASDADLKMLRAALSERDQMLLEVQRRTKMGHEDLTKAQLLVRDYENTVAQLSEQMKEHRVEIERLRNTLPVDELDAKDAANVELEERLTRSEGELTRNRYRLEEQATQVETLQTQLAAGLSDDELGALEARLAAVSLELEATRDELAQRVQATLEVEEHIQQQNAEVERLARSLSEANENLDYYRQRDVDQIIIEETEYVQPDDLTDIKGIGAVYSGKLREIGYFTFRHLADADVEQLKAALNVPEWRLPKLQEWIAQARAIVAEEGHEGEE